MRILIVDDAPVLRASFGRLAAGLGHTVAGEVATAADALALVPTLRPDAVVVDGRLPGGDPVALIVGLRASVPEARIYIIAALDETALVRSAVAAGAAGAVRRPFSRVELSARFAAGVRAGGR